MSFTVQHYKIRILSISEDWTGITVTPLATKIGERGFMDNQSCKRVTPPQKRIIARMLPNTCNGLHIKPVYDTTGGAYFIPVPIPTAVGNNQIQEWEIYAGQSQGSFTAMVYATDPYLETFAKIRAVSPPTDGENDEEYCYRIIKDPSESWKCLNAGICAEMTKYWISEILRRKNRGYCELNALLHSVWSCCIASKVGPDFAKRITNIHEDRNCSCFENCANKAMDFHNNQAGINAAEKQNCQYFFTMKCCTDALLNELQNGGLQTDWDTECCTEIDCDGECNMQEYNEQNCLK